MAGNNYFNDDLILTNDEGKDEEENRMVWTTEKVDELVAARNRGYEPKKHPFYNGNPDFKKADITFQLTEEEDKEMARCAKDVIYFAQNYAHVMTDEGVAQVELRDYQIEILDALQNNRENIINASRQIGKCHFADTLLTLKNQNNILPITIGELYMTVLKSQRKLSWIESAKYFLYKVLGKMKRKKLQKQLNYE